MTPDSIVFPEIRLRAMEPEDLDLLYDIENDTKLWDVGVTNVPYSRFVLHDYIARSSSDIYTDRQVRLMVENAEREVVGMVDMVNFDPRHMRAEIGIVIACAHRRRGYASAALEKVAEYARSVLHLHQLYIVADNGNKASVGLFGKMGYRITAELKDWLYDGKEYHSAVLMQHIL